MNKGLLKFIKEYNETRPGGLVLCPQRKQPRAFFVTLKKRGVKRDKDYRVIRHEGSVYVLKITEKELELD